MARPTKIGSEGPPQNRRFCGVRCGWFAYYCWAAGGLTLILRAVIG